MSDGFAHCRVKMTTRCRFWNNDVFSSTLCLPWHSIQWANNIGYKSAILTIHFQSSLTRDFVAFCRSFWLTSSIQKQWYEITEIQRDLAENLPKTLSSALCLLMASTARCYGTYTCKVMTKCVFCVHTEPALEVLSLKVVWTFFCSGAYH